MASPGLNNLKEPDREGSALGVREGAVLGARYKLGAVVDRGGWGDRLTKYLW